MPRSALFFTATARDDRCQARAGRVEHQERRLRHAGFHAGGHGRHGQGADPASSCDEAGAQIILANTYHLFLRPGTDSDPEIRLAAPLHGLGQAHPDRQRRLPDFFPAGANARVERAGRALPVAPGRQSRSSSPPRTVVDIQNVLDSDIQMVLDYFAPHPASRAQDEKALRLTSALGGPRPRALPADQPAQFPVRHRPGRPACRPARTVAARTGRHGFRRLRHRRLERRRKPGRIPADPAAAGAAACRPTSPAT